MARKYSLMCPVARTLDIIGDRWAILILRDLFQHETRRFQDFEATLPGLTPSVLSARLKDLESNAVISSRNYANHPPRLEYFLTLKGRELGPILQALKKWGEKHVQPLVSRPRNSRYIVAIKMGRRQGARREHI
jgi:DNA-binding HxlR family transcriptional regulator